MATYFVPYNGKRPATTDINGHRLVILSKSKSVFSSELPLVGADRIVKVRGGQSPDEDLSTFAQISRSANGNVVVAPPDASLSQVLENLKEQLPWLQ